MKLICEVNESIEILTEEKSQFQFYNNQYANRKTQSEAQDDLSSSLMSGR